MNYNFPVPLTVFLVGPASITAVNGSTVEFSCTASDAIAIIYFVNGSSAGNQDVQDKGFIELGTETLGGTVKRRNLTVNVSSQYNNTEIYCQAIGHGSNPRYSETANLTVQGPLSPVSDLSSSFINSSTVNISWSPPFTLPGTAITGYHISITSNGTTTNYFISDSYYVLQLSDITDSPCDEINITVSGYNGLNGETESLSVPSSDVVAPLSVNVSEDLQITVTINVTDVCIDEHPTTTVVIALYTNDTEVYRSMDVELFQSTVTNILVLNITFFVVEDQVYRAEVLFSILDGDFDINSRHTFNTFGVKSVDITDTTNDSVVFRCIFNSFSTDTGCTVQLVLFNTLQYTANFSRSGNTATGSISGVATGLYLVKVFDQGSSVVVYTTELNVTGEPAITTTTTTTTVTSSTVMILSTGPSTPLSTTTSTTPMATVNPGAANVAHIDSKATAQLSSEPEPPPLPYKNNQRKKETQEGNSCQSDLKESNF